VCKIHGKPIYTKALSMPPVIAPRSSAKTVRSARVKSAAAFAAPRVLLTGFEAFGDDPSGQGLNPSALAAQALHKQQIAGHQVVAAVLPCVFGASVKMLKALIREHRPSMVICLGQAGGRAGISLERVAVNLDDAPMPDNAGTVRLNTRVVPLGPTAYFSSLPIHAMLAALQRESVPCELSSSAGHFVCNHVFYALMHTLRKTKIHSGFVHLPYLPEQASAKGAPSMDLTVIVHGIRTAMQAALEAQ
jgi:pyroglutamyl-peptidase